MCLVAPAPAQDTFWFRGATNGNLTNFSNWAIDAAGTTNGTVPTADDVVVFNATEFNDRNQELSMANVNASYGALVLSNAGNTLLRRTGGTNTNNSLLSTLFLGTGLTNAAGAGSFTLGLDGFRARLRLADVAGDFFVVNHSASPITFTETTSLNTNSTISRALVASGVGNIDFAGGLADVSTNGAVASLRVDTLGTVSLATSSHSGGTTLETGTLALAGANAVGTGTLTINGGTLASSGFARILNNAVSVGGDFTVGGLGQSITLNGVIDLNGETRTITLGNSATVGGNIGNGGLVVASALTNRSLTIVSPVSYEGGTVVTGGVLALSGNGALPSDSTVELTSTASRATFDISGLSAPATTLGNLEGVTNSSLVLGGRTLILGGGNFRGTITGEGGALAKNGPGLLVIGNPSNSFSGGVTVNEGSLGLAAGAALGTGVLTIADGTSVGSVVSQRTIGNDVLVGGNVTLGLGEGSEATTFNGNINLGGAARAIDLGNSATFNGTISNGAADFTATLARTLRLNGTANAAISTSGALTLAGTGTVNGAVTVNGTLAPGAAAAAGTLAVTSTVNVTGTSQFRLFGNGLNDKLVTSGGAGLSGAVVVTNASGFTIASGDSFDLVDGAITGTPALVLPSLPAGLSWATNNFLATGVISVTGSGSAYDAWTGYWQALFPGFTDTAGEADPDGDGFTNDLEFAFDGNPAVGTPSLLSISASGSNAVVSWVQRNSGVTYAVQGTTNLASGAWTNASVTIGDSPDQSRILIPAEYTRKEFVVPVSSRQFFRVVAEWAP